MAAERRVVRVSQAFFDQLDSELRAERGPGGEASAHDFTVIELPVVIERFAMGFETLPEAIEGLPTARVLIAPGLLVRAFAAFGTLLYDGSIELIGITIEPQAVAPRRRGRSSTGCSNTTENWHGEEFARSGGQCGFHLKRTMTSALALVMQWR